MPDGVEEIATSSEDVEALCNARIVGLIYLLGLKNCVPADVLALLWANIDSIGHIDTFLIDDTALWLRTWKLFTIPLASGQSDQSPEITDSIND